MDNKGSVMRFISLDPSDLRIEALAPEKNNPGVFREVTFRAGEISYVMNVSDKVSALVIKNGVTIPVALPYQELKRMIYEPDFRAVSPLDLKPFTGAAVKGVLVPALADEFNDESGPSGDKQPGLQISAILRKNYSNETKRFDFPESFVTSYEALVSGTRAKNKLSVTVHFNQKKTRGPFGTGDAALDMPYEDFMAALIKAKKDGQESLDLGALFVANPKKYGFNPE
jgi:hypothetical protein